MQKTFSWRDAPDLMDRLIRAQNHPSNSTTDILTIAGLFDSRAELLRHVEFCEATIPARRAA
jgi:hypothetical protein